MSERVGWTNGCFDILHPGHIHFLRYCRTRCDRLIVGLNSDDSVRQLKGDGRPINNWEYRSQMLRDLTHEICQVEGEDDLVEKIKARARVSCPFVIFKGADYLGKEVRGWEFAPVRFVPLLEGYSTTKEIERHGLA